MTTWVDPWTDTTPGAHVDAIAQELKREAAVKAAGTRKRSWRGLGEKARETKRVRLARDWNEGVRQ